MRNGAVSVHVRLVGQLPRGARSELSVEGTIETARIDDVLHLERPAFSQADRALALFRLDSGGGSATRVSVRLGRVSAQSVEVLEGLDAGDRVIVSDMSRWDAFNRVDLD